MTTTPWEEAGRYRLVDELGVHDAGRRRRALGLHLGPNRLLMYKRQAPEQPLDLAAFRTLFYESAGLCRDLGHPNLSAVLDYGDEDGGCFSVHEMVAGHPLDQVLAALVDRGMRLPVNSAAYIAHQICSGLSFAHVLTDRSGNPLSPVHLELNPSTVIIGYDGSVRVLDAGLVPSARLTASGVGMWGKVPWFPPERVKGERLDPRADVYAVGLILFEILALKTLFDGESPEESMADILAGPAGHPSDYASDVPAALDRVVEQAMEPDPARRIGTAWEMEEALRDIVGGVELRRSRSTLSGMMNTIFAEARDEEQRRLRAVIMAVEKGPGFKLASDSSPPEDFDGGVSLVTPLPLPGFARSSRRRPEPEGLGAASGEVAAVPRAGTGPVSVDLDALEALDPLGDEPEPVELVDLTPAPLHDGLDPYSLETIPPLDEPAPQPAPEPESPAGSPPRLSVERARVPEAANDGVVEGPAAPRALRPWMLVAGTALLMTLALVGVVSRGEGGTTEAPPAVGDVTAGQALIDEIKAQNPDAEDADGGKAQLGWAALLETSPGGVKAARAALEQAVAVDPMSTPAVAGLAVAYAYEGDRTLDAANLLSRAQALGPGSPHVLRAEAGIALGLKNHERALAAARTCGAELGGDAICAYFEGLALVGLERLTEAVKPLKTAQEGLDPSPGLSLALGQAALASGDFAEALKALQGGAERFARDAGLQAELARLYYRTGDFDQALAHAERAVEVDSEHQEARLLRGELLLHVADKAQQAALALAELARDPALKGHELELRALLQASFAALVAGRADDAQAFAEQAVTLRPGYGPAQLALALSLDARGDSDASSEALLAAQLDGLPPRDLARFHFHAARLFVAHGRERFARDELEEALEADPDWLPAALALAEVHLKTGDLNAALARISGVAWVDLQADAGRAPLLLAPPVRLDTAPLEAALRQRIVDAIAPEPAVLRSYGALLTLDCVGGEARRCSEAAQRLEAALDIDPTDSVAQMMLAHVRAARGRHDAALELLARLVEAHVGAPVVYALLAEYSEALGRRESADGHFREAHNRAPEASGLYRRHALALAERGDMEGAHQQAARARSLDPDDLIAAGLLLR